MPMPSAPLGEVEFLQIDPTIRCNYGCAYCRGRSMRQEDIDPALVDAALDLFPRTRFVELHGEGEPLLHPRFFEIAAKARARGARVSVFTNGSLLQAHQVERLLDAGLEKVVISMDSADPERFRLLRTGRLEVVREGISRLMARRRERGLTAPAVGISATIQRAFTDDIPGLVDFYLELGLDGGIGYQPLNPAEPYARQYPPELLGQFLTLADLDALFRPIRDNPALNHVMAGSSPHRGLYDELFEPLVRGERACPWLERGAYVTTSGCVTPCCMLHDEHALGTIGDTPARFIRDRRDSMRAQLARRVVPASCARCEVAALVVQAPGGVVATAGSSGRPALPVVALPPADTRAAAPKVSVIIPCHNLGQFVEEAVDSVFAQTDQDFEIIVVNDGSTDDGTNAVLAGLSRPQTTVLWSEPRGLAAARNLAIAHARGRYLCALDADDRLHPQFLEKTTAVLDGDPGIAFVSTWLETFGDETWVWRQERCDFPALLAECVVLTAAPVRREAVEAVGGYDEAMAAQGDEDWDLWISVVERGYRGTILPEVLFYYRRRAGSMSSTSMRGDVHLRLWENLLQKHRESYMRHLTEVLLLKEAQCGKALLQNWTLEHDIDTRIHPRIAGKREELQRLTLERQQAHEESMATDRRVEELERALGQARAEIEALRRSWSWRVTAPLRRLCDIWLAVRRGTGPRMVPPA